MGMKGVRYASTVGSIMYAVRCSRPDVAFSHNQTSRYQQNPGESHWTAVKNILKYLQNTKDMFLIYGGDSSTELNITCYTDASWEIDQDDLRSQTSTTAMSSIEAEYIAASEAAKEAIWIRKFIYGLNVVPSIDKPMDIYCDNTGAITIADEPGVQKGAKHFRRKYHYIRKVIQEGDIRILKVVGHSVSYLQDAQPESTRKNLAFSEASGSKIQKDYKTEYKKMKAKFALLEASSSTPQAPNTFQPKNKGLVAKTFDYDEEEVIDDEDVT
ncbi:retrotransposon protein, putative, ty1-copia subclass [Tanacetum coccineum]